MITQLIFAVLTAGCAQVPVIDTYVQSGIQDLTLVAKITKGDQIELRKINKDFGASYQFKQSTLCFKLPFKMRAETKIEDSSIVYIINGTDLTMKLGTFKSKQNLANKPGRRQSPVEVGILTTDLFTTMLDAKFVEIDKKTDNVVFDLTYKQFDIDTSRNRVWVDQKKKYVTRREWFNQEGKPLATFTYTNPTEVNGVWVPTHMEVRNSENALAGVTDYTSIKVNSGLDDSLFEPK